MKILGLSLLGAVISTAAIAQPKPPIKPAAFTQPVTFQACATSWAFACGKHDAQGRTFGTAHQQTHCERYTFQPNGTYSVAGDFGMANVGTYKMIGSTVKITPTLEDGTKDKPFELVLSSDGKKLGTMVKL